jgi:hypothetical protein
MQTISQKTLVHCCEAYALYLWQLYQNAKISMIKQVKTAQHISTLVCCFRLSFLSEVSEEQT